jgi:protein tyrosine/serine phosphatase
MIRRFIEIIPGQFYRGSAPTPKDVLALKEKLGINKIVSLDEATGEKIDRACKMLNIQHVKIYINGERKSLLHALNQNLKHLFIDGGPTYVHCHEGKDRTGLMVALFKCKYMGMDPEAALTEAKSIGFGTGVDPKIRQLYEKIILSCKPNTQKDSNSADIVSYEREYKGDNRDGMLDEAHQGSFAPDLDHTRQNPMDALWGYQLDQSPTRQNYPDTSLFQYDPDKGAAVPNVGEFDNDSGQRGFGPTENYNGFFSEVGH